MSLIMIPSMVSNLRGEYYKGKNKSALDFTMLGNQKGFEDGTINTDYINEYKNNELERHLVIYSDVANTIFFFLFIILFKYLSALAQRNALIRTKTISDYTVYATGIPTQGVTERDIIEHFAQYGKVIDVVFSRKFGKMMKVYK